MFDVRFLSNPHFDPALRGLTGKDALVQRYLEALEPTEDFCDKAIDLLHFLLPQYQSEGKKYLTIGIGCTGGRHRSVYIAERLATEITLSAGAGLHVYHRDIGKS